MSETFATEEIYCCLDLAQGRSYHTVHVSVLLYESRKDRRTSGRDQNEDFHMINWQRVKSVFQLTRYFGSTDMNQLLVSSLLYIHPPTSTTVLSSTCQTPTSRDELSCAWLNQLTVGGRNPWAVTAPRCLWKQLWGRKVWTGERLYSVQRGGTVHASSLTPSQTACHHKSETAPSLSTCKSTSSAAQEGNVN